MERKEKEEMQKPLLDEDHLIAILAALPIPVSLSRKSDCLYSWEVRDQRGTASGFEEAFQLALAALQHLLLQDQVHFLRPPRVPYEVYEMADVDEPRQRIPRLGGGYLPDKHDD